MSLIRLREYRLNLDTLEEQALPMWRSPRRWWRAIRWDIPYCLEPLPGHVWFEHGVDYHAIS